MTCRGHLAGDGDQRHRVHLGVGQAGDQVERTGPGGRHHHAGLAAGPRVSLGREDAPLLVPRQDRPDPVAVSRQRLVQRHARAARIGEDDLDAVPHQRLDQNVGPGDRFRRGLGQRQAIVDGGHGESSLPGHLSSQARLAVLPGNIHSTTSVYPATIGLARLVANKVNERTSQGLPRFEPVQCASGNFPNALRAQSGTPPGDGGLLSS